MKPYTTRFGKTQYKPSEAELLEMIDQSQVFVSLAAKCTNT